MLCWFASFDDRHVFAAKTAPTSAALLFVMVSDPTFLESILIADFSVFAALQVWTRLLVWAVNVLGVTALSSAQTTCACLFVGTFLLFLTSVLFVYCSGAYSDGSLKPSGSMYYSIYVA